MNTLFSFSTILDITINMANKINIQGLNEILDPFYRYKMAKLNVAKQKNKIMINNFDVVCKDLDREPNILINYFKKKFNTSFTYKNNILTTTRTDVNYKEFEIVLREFIEKYVLCERCKLPETELHKGDGKNDEVTLICKCCSYVTKCT